MSDRLHLADEDALRLISKLSLVHEPIFVQRSTEGSEHIVWIVNQELVLRVPLAQQVDPDGLLREERVTNFLLQNIGNAALARAIPKVLKVGLEQNAGVAWRYAVYEKARGVSVENKPDAVTSATEADLAHLLQSLSAVSLEDATNLGVTRSDTPAIDDLAAQARAAWESLARMSMATALAGKSMEEALRQPAQNELLDEEESWVLSHNDLKGEHIFVDPDTNKLTGVIDWGDVQWAHPGVDIWGLVISIGAAAAVRVAKLAGRSPSVARAGLFLARCESVILLDFVMNGNSDAPEWLVRRQLDRAMEYVEV